MSQKQPPMKYNKRRGLFIGARHTDGLGGNAALTPDPAMGRSTKEQAIDRAIRSGLTPQKMARKAPLKDTD